MFIRAHEAGYMCVATLSEKICAYLHRGDVHISYLGITVFLSINKIKAIVKARIFNE